MRYTCDIGPEALACSEQLFPIQKVIIDWDELIRMRPAVVRSSQTMPYYLLMPEVLALLRADKHPMYRLLIDIMWSTGARVSEVLALTPERILGGNDRFDVLLKAKRTGAGRPGKLTALRSRQRCVPLIDEWTQDRLQTYLCGGHFRATQRLFAIAPQTLNRHIHRLADAIDFPAHWITATTFRHSFAINLLVHGCPLSAVARLLGHKHLASSAIYEQARTVSDHEMIKRVDFH